MCGRVSVAISKSDFKLYLSKTYGITEISDHIQLPRYNISPGQDLIAVLNDGKKNRCGLISWGMLPLTRNVSKFNSLLINAKAENLLQKKTFKASFETKRCIILIDGFYEWQNSSQYRQPFRVIIPNQSMFGVAGLYTIWHDETGKKYSTTIITTAANEQMSKIHNRMPVILDEEHAKKWLDPSNKDFEFLYYLLKPYASKLSIYPVSSIVNHAKNDTPECIKPVTPIIEPFL